MTDEPEISILTSTGAALLVQRQTASSTALLLGIAGAGHIAITDDTRSRRGARREGISAEALASIFQTGDGETCFSARVDTAFDGHHVIIRDLGWQSIVAVLIDSTAKVFPSLRCDVGIDVCCDDTESWSALDARFVGSVEAVDFVAAGERSQISVDLLVHERGHFAFVATHCRLGEYALELHVADGAEVNGGEFFDAVLEDLGIPSIEL